PAPDRRARSYGGGCRVLQESARHTGGDRAGDASDEQRGARQARARRFRPPRPTGRGGACDCPSPCPQGGVWAPSLAGAGGVAEGGMSRRALALRLAAAVAMLALAASLVLLARDVWHWQRAFADADARARLQPIGASAWAADTALPGSFVRSLLGIDDDLNFR